MFRCPYCGRRFEARADRRAHFARNPFCRRRANAALVQLGLPPLPPADRQTAPFELPRAGVIACAVAIHLAALAAAVILGS